jgi:hypothetical protein
VRSCCRSRRSGSSGARRKLALSDRPSALRKPGLTPLSHQRASSQCTNVLHASNNDENNICLLEQYQPCLAKLLPEA